MYLRTHTGQCASAQKCAHQASARAASGHRAGGTEGPSVSRCFCTGGACTIQVYYYYCYLSHNFKKIIIIYALKGPSASASKTLFYDLLCLARWQGTKPPPVYPDPYLDQGLRTVRAGLELGGRRPGVNAAAHGPSSVHHGHT